MPGLTTFIEPEKKSTEALATTIRAAGKAFSVFDAARLVLQSGDRFHVKFTVPADAPVKLCTIPADGSVWLGREEAVSHFLHSDGIKEFYRVEEIEMEEPKGVFTSIAVCGMTGEILGPTNHHSYQTTLHRIHREKFSDMRFEDYKRRVRTEHSPEIIEKWKDSQKRGQVWVYLAPALEEGAEPLRLKSRSEMESHFRKTHADNLVHETTEAWVAGNIPKQHLSAALYHALRRGVDDARKHLLPVAQILCSGFEGHGLKLFKRRGGKLWVSRTRPKALDNSVVLSHRIARMLEVVKAKPGIAVKDLVERVSPSVETPKAATQPEATPVPSATAPTAEAATATAPTTEATAAAPAPEAPEGSLAAETVTTPDSESAAPTPGAETKAPAATQASEPAQHEWNKDQLHALQDLHWLNSEGYVIEYSDGIVFIGVTEPPPPKPKPAKAADTAAPAHAAAQPAAQERAPAPESVSDEMMNEPAAAATVDQTSDELAAVAEVEKIFDEPAAVNAQDEISDESAAEAAEDEISDELAAAAAEDETSDEPAVLPFSFMDDPTPVETEEAAPGR